jgi:translation initiation factor 1 (eIF-1/SUI1)
LKFVDPSGRKIELTGDKAQDFIDYLEKKGVKLKDSTKNGVTTITGAKIDKDFKGNKEFAKLVKDVAGASGTAKFNVSTGQTNEKGEVVFFDDNEAAFKSSPFDAGKMRAGNVNMGSIQSVDSQDSNLAMALVGHFLVEGLEMRAPGANYDLGTEGAHQTGLEVERKILSEALGIKQEKRFSPPSSATTGAPISFVYTTVQYDMIIKSDGGATVNRVSPPTIARPKK